MTLTQRDLDEIEKIVDDTVNENTRNLPSKDEFFEKMDEVVGEVKAMREEYSVVTKQVSDHEDRITKVEKKLRISAA
jgi:predicted nuclease with TOPRIM domain